MHQEFPSNFGNQPEQRAEMRDSWPTISPQDLASIEIMGGAYRGLVSFSPGEKKFYDFWTERKSYYDNSRKRIVQIFVETQDADNTGNQSSMAYQLQIKIESATYEKFLALTFRISRKDQLFSSNTDSDLRNFVHELHKAISRIIQEREAELSEDIVRQEIAVHSSATYLIEEQL